MTAASPPVEVVPAATSAAVEIHTGHIGASFNTSTDWQRPNRHWDFLFP
jgi:hypothetical protein